MPRLFLFYFLTDILSCILQHDGVTYATGQDESVRGKFISNGVLDNSQDTNYRAIDVRVMAIKPFCGTLLTSMFDT